MENPKPYVSVIIINYNSAEYTVKCVNSVIKETSNEVNYEIIVIDNASAYNDYLIIKKHIESLKLAKIRIHRSLINTGFGGGNMEGVSHANGSYYLFLNNDAVLLNDAISTCLTFMKNTSDAAVCGGNIFNEAGGREISFDYFTSFAREAFGKKFVEVVYKKPDRKAKHERPIKVDYVNGSFMLFNAKDFDRVGGFDTNIFLYFEESDICHRLLQQGRLTYFIPDAHYLHYHGKSTEKAITPVEHKIELKTSMFYVIKKNLGSFQFHALRIFFILRYGVSSLIKSKNRPLFRHIINGLPMSESLRHAQETMKK